jgi:hypothetical protein
VALLAGTYDLVLSSAGANVPFWPSGTIAAGIDLSSDLATTIDVTPVAVELDLRNNGTPESLATGSRLRLAHEGHHALWLTAASPLDRPMLPGTYSVDFIGTGPEPIWPWASAEWDSFEVTGKGAVTLDPGTARVEFETVLNGATVTADATAEWTIFLQATGWNGLGSPLAANAMEPQQAQYLFSGEYRPVYRPGDSPSPWPQVFGLLPPVMLSDGATLALDLTPVELTIDLTANGGAFPSIDPTGTSGLLFSPEGQRDFGSLGSGALVHGSAS